jgi:hypothetical protein
MEIAVSPATSEPAQATGEPTLWTLQETARFLRVNEATIRIWMKIPGKLPTAKRLGQKWLFVASEVRSLVEA